MNIMKRTLCLVLSVVMTVTLFVPAADTVFAQAAPVSNIGASGAPKGKDAHALSESVTYLSDLYGTEKKVSSFVIGTGSSETNPRDFKLDTNWDNAVFVWTGVSQDGGASRKAVNASNSPRTLQIKAADGTTSNVVYNRGDIAIGYRGTKYAKGLAALVSASNKKPASVVYDLQGLDMEYFYSVVGITGQSNVNPAVSPYTYKLTFNVYGSKDGTDDSDFELLSYATGIRAYLTAEFNVDIRDYKYLKLETVSDGGNSSGTFVWADACLYKTERSTFSVQTVWDDAGNESYRPSSFLAYLTADGNKTGAPVTLNAENNFSYTWSSVPKYNAAGEEVKYGVTASVPNYKAAYSDGILTNKFVYDTDFTVSVNWSDKNDVYGVRPSSLELQLYADGEAYGSPVSVYASDGWVYTWTSLPARKTGQTTPINYSVAVTEEPEYYSVSVDGEVIKATCTYNPAEQKVSYTTDVLWVDETVSSRPSSLNVQLFADDTDTGLSAVLSSENNWSCTWTDLPKHKSETDLSIVNYTAKVSDLPSDYAAVYSGRRIIICTYRQLIDYSLKAVWDDSDNEPGIRPDSLKVQLKKDGQNLGDAEEISAGNDWSYTWTDLYSTSTGAYRAGDGSFNGAADVAGNANLTQLSSLTYIESSNIKGAASTVNYPYGGSSSDSFIIGENNTKFTRGIGVHPEAPSISGGESWTTYDISSLDADRFYAAVGITNANGKAGNSQGVIFRVFGDYGDGSYVLLAESDKIAKKDSGEFDVGISGVKKLKLAVYPAGTNNWSSASVWANACVYKSTGVCGPEADYTVEFEGLPEEYEVSIEGGIATLTYLPKKDYDISVVWNDNNDLMKHRPDYVNVRAYIGNKADDYVFRLSENNGWKDTVKLPIYAKGTTNNVTYTFKQDPVPQYYSESVSGGVITNKYAPNLPGKYTASSNGNYSGAKGVKKGSIKYLSNIDYTDSINNGGKPTTKNYPYGTTSGVFKIGEKDTAFSVGLGVHPEALSAQYVASTTYDLSKMNVDRFYAAVGLTSSKGKEGASRGVVFRVYGDYADGSSKLLAQSNVITMKKSGEFLVDITGAKQLRLEIIAPGENHYSSGSAWANACVFKYDKNGESFSGNKIILPGTYTPNKSGNYTTHVNAAKGSVKFLSDMKYTEASNTTNKDFPKGKATTLDHPYGEIGNIIIGKKAQKIKKGLGVHPKPAANTKGSWTTYDLSKMKVDRFYAVVGLTNENAKKGKSEPIYFRVYADYGDGNFIPLAESDNISKTKTGEFDVDITGVKKLKLMVFATGSNISCGSVWGNACVYKYQKSGSVKIHTNNSTLNYLLNYKASKGDYTENLKAAENSVQFLSKMDNKGSSNTTNDKYPKGQPTNYNHPYGSLAAIARIGKNNQFFYTGLGMHPKNPKQPINGSIESYTIYDLRNLDVNRFYSALGLTNTKGKNGNSKGTIFRVYADYKGNGSYKLIGQSDIILGYMSGEFDLDISDAKYLKLAVVSATSTHASSAVFWANACVYKYDEKGSVNIHTNHIGPQIPPKAQPTDNYYPSKDGFYQGLPFEYDKNSVFITQLAYLDSSNTTNATYPYGQPSTIDHPYGKPEDVICIGEQEALFFEGLGMHPKNPALPVDYSIESWTLYDISELGANRFYSALGITNSNGKAGKSQGVIYRIYADYGDGVFVKIGESENLTKKMSGEFIDVDITGVKILKLAVVCGGTAHDSSACAWAGASFYSTEGPLNLPKPERPDKTKDEEVTTADDTAAAQESGSSLGTGAIIAIAAGSIALIGGGVTAFIIAGKKRSKKDEEEQS